METEKTKIGYLLVVGAVFILLMAVCRISDPFFITGIVAAFILLVSRWPRPLRITLLDICILSLWAYDAVLLTAGINPVGSFPYFKILTQSVLFYAMLRAAFQSEWRIKALLAAGCVFILLLALIAVVSFIQFSGSVRPADFGDLYHLRFLYRPLGNISNVWGSYQILFLGSIGLSTYYYRKSAGMVAFFLLASLPVWFSAIVSFSRGVYLSCLLLLTVFGVAILLSRLVLWKKALLILVPAIVLTGMSWPYRAEVLRTFKMNSTVSQQRSTASRIDAGNVAWEVLMENPVFGAGSGNYSLAVNGRLYEDDNLSYTSFSSSVLWQLLVEKGILGTLLWLLLPAVLVWMAAKDRERDWRTLVIFTTLAAVGCRELTYPVFFESPGYQLFVFMFLAIYQNGYPSEAGVVFSVDKTSQRGLKWCVGFIFLLAFVPGIWRHCRSLNDKMFYMSVIRNDLTQAAKYTESDPWTVPGLLNRSTLDWLHFRQTDDTACLRSAMAAMEKATRLNPRDVQLQYRLGMMTDRSGDGDSARKLLSGLVDRYPANALYRFSLARLIYRNGNTREAAFHLSKAIELSPRIMDTHYWNVTCSADTAYYHDVVDYLREDADQKTVNPIISAKYGKIMLNLCDTMQAERYLTYAVDRLPNLSSPWYSLGSIALGRADTANAKLYLRRAVVLAPDNTRAQAVLGRLEGGGLPAGHADDANDYRFLTESYRLKCLRWYSCQPIHVEFLN